MLSGNSNMFQSCHIFLKKYGKNSSFQQFLKVYFDGAADS